MSFSPKTELPAGLTDSTPGRTTQQSPTEVLPLVRGRGRVVARPITDVLHWKFQNTKTQSIAYFSCAYELCLGPVDEFLSIIVNGKAYHGVYKRRDDYPGTEYVEQIVSKAVPETFRLYWGTEEQLNPTAYIQSRAHSGPATTATHPRYAGRALLVVTQMEAGNASSGKTPQVPKIEVEVFCRSTSAFDYGHSSIGHPPIGIIRDLLTLKRGGGKLGTDVIDADEWDAATEELDTNGIAGITGEELWTSFVFDKPRALKDQVAEVMGYFYGYLRERDGRLQVGWSPADGSTADPTGLREITLHHMAAEPRLMPDGLDKMPTKVIVTGLDWLSSPALQEDSADAMVPFARRLLQEDRPPLQLSRPGFVSKTQLKACANMEAAARSNPSMQVRLTVLRQYATHADEVTPLRPGDLFTLDWEPLALDVVMRVLERSKETAVTVDLLAEVERGAFPRPYNSITEGSAAPTPEPPDDLVRYLVAQMPPDLSDAADTRVCALVERVATDALGFHVEFAPTDSFPGQTLEDGNVRWAVACQLVGALASGLADTTITVDNVGVDWEALAVSRSDLEKADDQLLCYHGGEWLSIGTITPLGGGQYSLAVSRARLASLPADHADDDVLFVIPRGDLIALTHSDFLNVEDGGEYDETTATKFFKIRPYNAAGNGNWTASTTCILRDPTPDQVEGLAVAFSARAANLTWDKLAGALVNEYQVLRATGPGYADEAVVGEVSGTAFMDVVPAYGVTYRWRVRAVATDETPGVLSDPVTGAATGVDVTTDAPGNPDAPTFNAEDSYLADDGGAFSYIQINLPVMPAGAAVLNVLYRVNGSTSWVIGDQKFAGGGVARIDDLSVGVTYQFALQAVSRFGQPSAVSGILTRAAPNGIAAPSTPTGLNATGYLENITLDWNDNAEKNLIGYEVWRGTASNGETYLTTVSASTFVDTQVAAATTYYYKIKAIIRGGTKSGLSSEASAMRGEQSGGGGAGTYSLTLYGHTSGLGTPGSGPVVTHHTAGTEVALNADASVSGDAFLNWTSPSPFDLDHVANPASNTTSVAMVKNLVLYANYDE